MSARGASHDGYVGKNLEAGPGEIWVCAGCGRRSHDLHGRYALDAGWGPPCAVSAVLCQNPPEIKNGRWVWTRVTGAPLPGVPSAQLFAPHALSAAASGEHGELAEAKRERSLRAWPGTMPAPLQAHIDCWLASNEKQATEVRHGSFPLDMVARLIERAEQAERERDELRASAQVPVPEPVGLARVHASEDAIQDAADCNLRSRLQIMESIAKLMGNAMSLTEPPPATDVVPNVVPDAVAWGRTLPDRVMSQTERSS